MKQHEHIEHIDDSTLLVALKANFTKRDHMVGGIQDSTMLVAVMA
jgi:hypothetical protein